MLAWQAVLPTLAILGGVVILLSRTLEARVPTPTIAYAQATPCEPSPAWAPAYLSGPGAARPQDDGWFLPGVAAIGTQVCTPGLLNIVAEAESAGGDPEVTVLLDGRVLTTQAVQGIKEISVSVPRAGNLQVAYLNDYYQSDVRSVDIRQIRMNVAGCRILLPDLPLKNHRNGYVRPSEILGLLEPEPVTFRPCGAGTLSFTMLGYPGNGILPIVEIRQASALLAKLTAPAERQSFELEVAAGPVTFNFTNPYAREVADRNLILKKLTWEPAR